ncbi:hypothetical protein BV22DRAFT_1196352 [Leucogyrophana mollusca]|uniref:Uncharacterized protein n=1 Tax=Leucogyrophana mollusca TaxID=85980 RepID=A0ACB8BF82_9AGAM|nr:hypothetical protein BV22DRAFT_1196352 [Leucogyrophana mollusca]
MSFNLSLVGFVVVALAMSLPSTYVLARPLHLKNGLIDPRPENERRSIEHLPPAGSDTFNPGTLSHPFDMVGNPLKAVTDDEGLDLPGISDLTSLPSLSAPSKAGSLLGVSGISNLPASPNAEGLGGVSSAESSPGSSLVGGLL